MPQQPSVSVIVPAYNAAASVRATLRSVSAQTRRDLEIIVVDDGSTDATASLVVEHQRSEPRLRLLQQDNAGVSAARNAGINAAEAPLIAPIDADDLWAATRIARHLEVLERHPEAGFVYSPFRAIDHQDRVIDSHPIFGFEGRVFYRQLFFNMVGNGSGITFKRDLAQQVGGYDEALRGFRLEGAEDWLLQMRLSLLANVVQAPEYLIGYRKPGAISADPRHILRSQAFCLERLRPYAPRAADRFLDAAQLHFQARAALLSIRRPDFLALSTAFARGLRHGVLGDLAGEAAEAWSRALRARARRRKAPGPLFMTVDPRASDETCLGPYIQGLISRLAEADSSL